MDDSEIDFSNQEVFSSQNLGDIPSSRPIDSLFDELLKDTHTCTHTHTCNPPGRDYSHTHTCFHVHTKLVSASNEGKVGSDDTAESAEKNAKKRPLGNKEAVRKYREKKKARAASLEDEVVKLRSVNQQLRKRLQGQSALEAEIARLKCLLVDVRGRIEGEIGSFPYQRPVNSDFSNQIIPSAFVMNPCNLQSDDQVYCLHPGADGRDSPTSAALNELSFGACEFENLQCLANQNSGLKELSGCGLVSQEANGISSGGVKRRAAGYMPLMASFQKQRS